MVKQIWTGSIALLVFGVVAFMYAWTTQSDPDLWGHIRFGQDLLHSHQVNRVDIYSYTTGSAVWVNHEWLSEAALAWSYDHAGAAGLVWLKLALAMTAAVLAFVHLIKEGMSPL